MISSDSNSLSADLSGKAIDLLRRGVFPEWWSFVPVAGKATFIKEWSTKPLAREQCITEYKTRRDYAGLGVVTGAFSGGLIALDIDGHEADQRYREVAGKEYEAPGGESTMAWTSGKPGRRQILYKVPAALVDELAHVKTLILRVDDGEWHLGHGDTNRAAGGEKAAGSDKPYEEVVLRFNGCQSVVPGSKHPETGKLYSWLSYKEVADAPAWILDVLRGFRKPTQWLTDAQQKALDAELGETAVPSRQIRGWFFKEEVQRLLNPRLSELIFQHEVFDQYGWKLREGNNPQMMSGCPWHEGRSGTAFQYSTLSGCWDCKACGIGGDVLDFVHKIRVKDRFADKPQGPDLEAYVADIAAKLGFDYPACAKAVEVTTKEVPVRRLTGHEFFKAAQAIDDQFDNAELGDYHLMELVRDAGLTNVYRSGPAVRMALERFMLHETQQKEDADWQKNVRGQREYLIPDFISKPSSIMLHARGGLGKTRLAVLLAKIVGRQEEIKIRGLTVQPTSAGNVLFIGNDMSEVDYAEYFDAQGVDSSGADQWMKFKANWQQSQYKVLLRWLKDYKPALVVVDSLTSVSTMIAARENEAEYAHTLYRLARENGKEFPATTFLWIHHNTKDGGRFRGTDTLRNAVHETWELKELTDEERVEFGDGALILQIDKSRGMRGGDRFLVREDIEEVMTIEDLTPTVCRENNGLGDEKPRTVVLGILKEAGAALSYKQIRYDLNARLTGRRGQGAYVSRRTVERWVQHWVSAGLVEPVSVRQSGVKGGRPTTCFRAVSPLRERNYDQNLSDFTENASAAMDLGFGHDSGQNDQNPKTTETPESVAAEMDEIHKALATSAKGVTESPPQAAGLGEPDVLATLLEKEGVTKTPSAETLAAKGIPEDGPEVLVISSLVKGEALSSEFSDDWGLPDFG